MKNCYPSVIETLMYGTLDHKRIVTTLAQKFPSIFMQCCQVSGQAVNPLDDKLQNIWKTVGKIAAIKECRALTNMGLKEAKDYCEKICANIPAAGSGW